MHLSTSVGSFIQAALAAFLLGCGSENSIPENTSQPVQPQPIGNPFLPITPIVPPQPEIKPDCNRDLAGTCFNNPPTIGALQA